MVMQGMMELIALVLLPIAAIMHLAATLEIPYRLFEKTKLFRAAEDSAFASRWTCITANVVGVFAAKTAVPTSWGMVGFELIVFFASAALVAAYVIMISQKKKNWFAPSDILPQLFIGGKRATTVQDFRNSALLCGWLPTILFTVWTLYEYFG